MGYPADSTPTWKYSYQAIHALRPLFCSLQVTGVEHVPRQGGVVLACNHPGGLDSFVLGYASSRQVYYMAKRELFNVHPLVTRFLHGIGAFPINRGARDTAALEHSVNLLREGLVLGMFPEGTRNRGMPLRRGRSGVARVALEADVPIVPVAVQGIPHLHQTWRNPFDRTHVSVQFGQPLRFAAGTMEKAPEYTTEVMIAIARMMPPELRGQYGDTIAPSREKTPPQQGDAAASRQRGAGDSANDAPAN